MYKLFGIIGQWIGLLLSMSGIIIITYLTNDIGSFFIAFGGLLWGLGTKVKYYKGINIIQKHLGKPIDLDVLPNGYIKLAGKVKKDMPERSN